MLRVRGYTIVFILQLFFIRRYISFSLTTTTGYRKLERYLSMPRSCAQIGRYISTSLTTTTGYRKLERYLSILRSCAQIGRYISTSLPQQQGIEN